METKHRVVIVLVFWLLCHPFTLPGMRYRRPPTWVSVGYLSGGLFLLTTQAYSHYFVAIVPFAALAGAPIVSRLRLSRGMFMPLAAVMVAGSWATDLVRHGPGSDLVSVARFSAMAPTVHLLDRFTCPLDRVLTDRFDFTYLSHRTPVTGYFWNLRPTTTASSLEHLLPGVTAVVGTANTYGFPLGFREYLDRHLDYQSTITTNVWLRSSAPTGTTGYRCHIVEIRARGRMAYPHFPTGT